MPFQEGNTLGAKSRRVERMLERAVLQDDEKRLRQGVEKVLDLFAEGERWAVEFVRDTLDGKPKQAVDVGTSDPDRALVVRVQYGKGQTQANAAAEGALVANMIASSIDAD
jgi:hypothetical protein